MMKHEFEKLVGMDIGIDCYEKIEYVYMLSTIFDNVNGKQQVADFYLLYGMEGIERLYRDIRMKLDAIKRLESLEDAYQSLYEENKRLRVALKRIEEQVRLSVNYCGI